MIDPHNIPKNLITKKIPIDGVEYSVHCFGNWGIGIIWFRSSWYLYHEKSMGILKRLCDGRLISLVKICYKEFKGYDWNQDAEYIIEDVDFKKRIFNIQTHIKRTNAEFVKEIRRKNHAF